MLALRFNTNVLNEMYNLAGELDNVWGSDGNGGARRAGWAPAVDVHETEDLVTLAVELPGVNPQQVNLTVQNGVLTIAGEKHGTIAKCSLLHMTLHHRHHAGKARAAVKRTIWGELTQVHSRKTAVSPLLPCRSGASPALRLEVGTSALE